MSRAGRGVWPIDVRCPFCDALPGHGCVVMHQGFGALCRVEPPRFARYGHRARREAASEQAILDELTVFGTPEFRALELLLADPDAHIAGAARVALEACGGDVPPVARRTR